MTAAMTDEEIDVLNHLNNKIFYQSHFNILKTHNGLRPGCLHTFLGTSGGGKSTLIRSLLIDFLENSEKDIVLFLSEESKLDFLSQFHKTGYKKNLDKLHIISELDLSDGKKTDAEIWKELLFQISEIKPSLFVYDNITTSRFYMDKKPNEQSKFSWYIKKLCLDKNIPFILVAHTGGLINDSINRLIEPNDIRGAKTIINISHFFYVMQRFILGDTIYPTVRITKHRSQDIEKSIFKINYDKKRRIYIQDVALNFKDFKEAYKARNVL